MAKQVINKKQASKLSNNKVAKKIVKDITTVCNFFISIKKKKNK